MNTTLKKCRLCHKEKSPSEYYPHSRTKGGFSYDCIACAKERASISYFKNRERNIANSIRWQKRNPEIVRKYWMEKSKSNRRKVLEGYGGKEPKCKCCGESELMFLAIDHVNNDGHIQRKQMGQKNLYVWLIKNHFPIEFQLLCHNCNMGKHINKGICPHKTKTCFNGSLKTKK